MTGVIEWSDDAMALGRDDMDQTHKEMIDLLNAAAEASNQDFPAAFDALFDHTRAHFDHEAELMEQSGDPARKEHEHQHRKLIGEFEMLQRRVAKGQIKMARAFVRERVPEWFLLHAASMDSMLAAHLKGQTLGSEMVIPVRSS